MAVLSQGMVGQGSGRASSAEGILNVVLELTPREDGHRCGTWREGLSVEGTVINNCLEGPFRKN